MPLFASHHQGTAHIPTILLPSVARAPAEQQRKQEQETVFKVSANFKGACLLWP
jgi:hypothetical protein